MAKSKSAPTRRKGRTPKLRKFKIKDPFAEREAGRYPRPIPSREAILAFLKGWGGRLSLEEIAREIGLHDPRDLEALQKRLEAMVRDGQILRDRQGRYLPINQRDLVTGRVVGHADGFGFLKPEEGGEDLYLPPSEMRQVMHGDRVVVAVTGVDRRGRKEASVVEVLERAHKRIVGRLMEEAGVYYVIPEHRRIPHDILIPRQYLDGAQPGQIVVVEIVTYPSRKRQAVGRVVEVLGEQMAPGMEVEIALRAFEIPHQFPEEVLQEARALPDEVSEADKRGRVDLRHLPFVTIDGPDARDFDDAVFGKKTRKGWKLYVAIADVSHYVKPDTALDQEALKRGNSVYFPQRVVPMLPEKLSNELCSLKPKVDRLVMVCEMEITPEGKIRRSRFYEGVIHSHARLIYEDVAAMMVEGDRKLRRRYRELLPHLETLFEIYRALRREREARGAIDFETEEYRILFGENQKIEKIVPVERTEAHRLIEECMIAANRATARFLNRKKIPYLRRIHDRPDPEKVAELRQFLRELGLELKGGDEPKPRHFMEVLEKARGRPDFHLIQTVILRAMPPAIYSPDKRGHFGLALETYCHSTSPIRRYPDLLVHRAVRHALQGGKPETFRYSESELALIGDHCSMTERRADEAVWDVIAWLKCEYMRDKVGEVFWGVISAVKPFGFFVELKGIYTEGLVHISTLGRDFYHYDPIHHRLVGERTGKVFRVGDLVRVKVVRVDLDERRIELQSLPDESQKGRRSLQGAPKKRRVGKR